MIYKLSHRPYARHTCHVDKAAHCRVVQPVIDKALDELSVDLEVVNRERFEVGVFRASVGARARSPE